MKLESRFPSKAVIDSHFGRSESTDIQLRTLCTDRKGKNTAVNQSHSATLCKLFRLKVQKEWASIRSSDFLGVDDSNGKQVARSVCTDTLDILRAGHRRLLVIDDDLPNIWQMEDWQRRSVDVPPSCPRLSQKKKHRHALS